MSGGYKNIALVKERQCPVVSSTGRSGSYRSPLDSAPLRGGNMLCGPTSRPDTTTLIRPLLPFGATPSNVTPLNNTFIVRATGGVQFISGVNSIGAITSQQCFISPGGSGWNCVSDRNVKHTIKTVSPKSVLARLMTVPVSTWAFNGNERRQIGPMAQDFSAPSVVWGWAKVTVQSIQWTRRAWRLRRFRAA